MKIRITCRGTLEHALKGTNFSGNLLLLIFKGGLLLNHSVKALESDIIHPSNLNLQPLNRPSPFNPHPGGYAAEKQIPISNPTPYWTLKGHLISNAVPVQQYMIITTLDFALIALSIMLLVKAFGWRTTLMGLTIFFAFPPNGYSFSQWILGSYMRMSIVLYLSAALYGIKKENYYLAGAALALLTLERVFPAGFALFAVSALAIQGLIKKEGLLKERTSPVLKTAVGGISAAVLVWMATAILYGHEPWMPFIEFIQSHNERLWANHLGWAKAVATTPTLGMPMGSGEEYGQLNNALLYQRQNWILFQALKIFALLSILFLYPLKHSKESAMAIGGWALMYFFSLPANYYYVIILPIAVALISEKEKDTRNLFLWSIAAATLLGHKNLNHGMDTYLMSIAIGVGIITISLRSIPKIGKKAQWAIIPLMLLSLYQVDWKEPNKKGYIPNTNQSFFQPTRAILDEQGRNIKSENPILIPDRSQETISFMEPVIRISIFADLPENGELEINTEDESLILIPEGKRNVLKEYQIEFNNPSQDISLAWNQPDAYPLVIFKALGLPQKN